MYPTHWLGTWLLDKSNWALCLPGPHIVRKAQEKNEIKVYNNKVCCRWQTGFKAITLTFYGYDFWYCVLYSISCVGTGRVKDQLMVNNTL